MYALLLLQKGFSFYVESMALPNVSERTEKTEAILNHFYILLLRLLLIIKLENNFFMLWEVVIFFPDGDIVPSYNSGISQAWAPNT